MNTSNILLVITASTGFSNQHGNPLAIPDRLDYHDIKYAVRETTQSKQWSLGFESINELIHKTSQAGIVALATHNGGYIVGLCGVVIHAQCVEIISNGMKQDLRMIAPIDVLSAEALVAASLFGNQSRSWSTSPVQHKPRPRAEMLPGFVDLDENPSPSIGAPPKPYPRYVRKEIERMVKLSIPVNIVVSPIPMVNEKHLVIVAGGYGEAFKSEDHYDSNTMIFKLPSEYFSNQGSLELLTADIRTMLEEEYNNRFELKVDKENCLIKLKAVDRRFNRRNVQPLEAPKQYIPRGLVLEFEGAELVLKDVDRSSGLADIKIQGCAPRAVDLNVVYHYEHDLIEQVIKNGGKIISGLDYCNPQLDIDGNKLTVTISLEIISISTAMDDPTEITTKVTDATVLTNVGVSHDLFSLDKAHVTNQLLSLAGMERSKVLSSVTYQYTALGIELTFNTPELANEFVAKLNTKPTSEEKGE